MKRRIAIILAAVLLLALAASAVWAEPAVPTVEGVYGVNVEADYESTVTVKPMMATAPAGSYCAAELALINGANETFYREAAKFEVSYSAAELGKQYMVWILSGTTAVPTVSNISYLDQVAATSASVTFTAFPSDMAPGVYSIYISSNASTGITSLTKVASFKYYVAYKLGDVNEDTNVRVDDVTMILNHIVENITLTGNQVLAADVTKDGNIRIDDVTKILNYIVENITSLED
jgi:hypothetical protein